MTAPAIRVDPLTGLRTIVAPTRLERPGGGLVHDVAPSVVVDPERDPFLPGHEDQTPPEVYAVRPDGSAPDTPGWLVRAFPNRYPALVADPPAPAAEANPDLFTQIPAQGAHEVIVNAPEPVSSLTDLDEAQLVLAVEAWRERMRAHADAACRHLIVNQGAGSGASIPHTHAQLFAPSFVPAAIARERERFAAHAVRTMGSNLLGDLVQEEVRRRERLVAVDDEAVLFCAYAPRGPYHLIIAPRRPAPRWEDAGTPSGAALLAGALAALAVRFGSAPPLNLWIRTAPQGADHFSWRIEILPRLTNRAGLELGTGVEVSTVAPEQAAADLRDARSGA